MGRTSCGWYMCFGQVGSCLSSSKYQDDAVFGALGQRHKRPSLVTYYDEFNSVFCLMFCSNRYAKACFLWYLRWYTVSETSSHGYRMFTKDKQARNPCVHLFWVTLWKRQDIINFFQCSDMCIENPILFYNAECQHFISYNVL